MLFPQPTIQTLYMNPPLNSRNLDASDTFVAFACDSVETQTDSDAVRQLESRHKLSLQQMKEQVLNSVCILCEFTKFKSMLSSGLLWHLFLRGV